MLQIQHEKILEEIEQLKTVLADANARLMDAKRGREDDDENDIDDKNEGIDANGTIQGEKQNMDDNDNCSEGNVLAENTNSKSCSNSTPKKMNRATKLQRLEEIRKERSIIEKELEELKENDPQAVADLEKEFKLVRDAANRWTDNIFNCKSYLIKKRNIDKKDANRMLGITDAFDCKL
jgi:Leucine zipper with capping helix domain